MQKTKPNEKKPCLGALYAIQSGSREFSRDMISDAYVLTG